MAPMSLNSDFSPTRRFSRIEVDLDIYSSVGVFLKFKLHDLESSQMSLLERSKIETDLEKWEEPAIFDRVRMLHRHVTVKLNASQVHAELQDFSSADPKSEFSPMTKPDVRIEQPVPTEDVSHFVNATVDNWVAKMPIRLIDLEHHTLISRSDLAAEVKKRLKERYFPDDKDSGETSFVEELGKLDRSKWNENLKKELDPLLSFAILSHRWCSSEPSLQDAMEHVSHWLPRRLSEPSIHHTDPGLQKLVMFCKTAHALGYRLAWTDTCCIDKTSSAEHQESINSMFTWYRQAHVCIVHMAQTGHHANEATHPYVSRHNESRVDSFTSRSHDRAESTDTVQERPLYYLQGPALQLLVCDDRRSVVRWEDEWFSRGWTLPELLAPRAMKFYTWDWQELVQGIPNHKNYRQLLTLLEEATDIPAEVIRDFDLQKRRTFEEKMRWASRRTTTRGEDMAYCLLGLFDLNMPILYGEGTEEAFFRFQLEYMKSSSDLTIFKWEGKPSIRNSLTASRPICFDQQDTDGALQYQPESCCMRAGWFCGCLSHLGCCIPTIGANKVPLHLDFSPTNMGIRMRLKLHPVSVDAIPEERKSGEFQEKYLLRITAYRDVEIWVRPNEITDSNRKTLAAVRLHDMLVLLRPTNNSRRSGTWVRIHTESPIQTRNHWTCSVSRITRVKKRVIYIQ
jgi:hypothetical protein